MLLVVYSASFETLKIENNKQTIHVWVITSFKTNIHFFLNI